jgi:hypothetical protein
MKDIKTYLDTQKDLLDGDGWPPVLLFVQQGQADCARWIDIGVEKWRHKLDLWGCAWVVILK